MLNLTIGDNPLIGKAKYASEETKKAVVKEEIENEILNVQIEKISSGEELTKEEIAERLNTIGKVNNYTEEMIEGEYKNYEFWVDENNKVIIGNLLKGDRPKGGAFIVDYTEGLEEVTIGVWGEISDGIVKIESLSGLEESEIEENIETTIKTYKVTENGTYYFRITGNYGRSIIVSCSVNKDIMPQKDILSAVQKMNDNGIRKIEVAGKTEEGEKTIETYCMNTIIHKGNVILDGTTNIYGATLVDNVYEFGCQSDIATENEYAKSTVVLKVEGDLTINPQVSITAKGGTYGGPKGMIIYCTGTLTNNGTISMTARGAKAEGQDVYILKNADESFEYVPKLGESGRSRGY